MPSFLVSAVRTKYSPDPALSPPHNTTVFIDQVGGRSIKMPSTAHVLVHDPEVVIEVKDHFRGWLFHNVNVTATATSSKTYCRSGHFYLEPEAHALYDHEPECATSTGKLSIGCTYNFSRH